MVLVIPNTYIVAIKGQSGGQDIVNVIGVTGSGNTAISVATAVEGAWKVSSGPLSRLPSQYQLREVKAMDIGSTSGDVYTVSSSGVGGQAGSLATNGSAALVTFGAGTRAKSQRGRLYFGPLRENDIDTDGRTCLSAASISAAFGLFKTALEVNNRKWCVISRKFATTTDVVTVSTQSIIATQRRRIR